MTLNNRRALITGASQGFGRAVAGAFVEEGAHVALCARNAELLFQTQKDLTALREGKSQVLAIPTDVSKPDQVEHLVQTTLNELGGLEILVSNAGVYGPKGPIETTDWAEWSEAVDINLKGTVLLCRTVVPHFKKRAYGKIVVLSGGGATKPMPYLSAYAASKAAVVRFAESLAEELLEYGVDVNSVAPGALNTRLLDEVLEAGPERVGAAFYEQSVKQKAQGGSPVERGVSLCVFLASAASDGITGKLISAVWDPWMSLKDHFADLRGTDIYTLRRIVPKDRGMDWG